MKHIKLFETFQDSGMMRKVYATCFQEDAFAGVGLLDEDQMKKLQDAIDEVSSDFPEIGDKLHIDIIDITGMGYVLYDVDGEFKAMPKSTNPDHYTHYINRDGETPNKNYGHSSTNEEDRLFDLVPGAFLSTDQYGDAKLIPLDEFISKYITGV